jgi:hypothetical protein
MWVEEVMESKDVILNWTFEIISSFLNLRPSIHQLPDHLKENQHEGKQIQISSI